MFRVFVFCLLQYCSTLWGFCNEPAVFEINLKIPFIMYILYLRLRLCIFNISSTQHIQNWLGDFKPLLWVRSNLDNLRQRSFCSLGLLEFSWSFTNKEGRLWQGWEGASLLYSSKEETGRKTASASMNQRVFIHYAFLKVQHVNLELVTG